MGLMLTAAGKKGLLTPVCFDMFWLLDCGAFLSSKLQTGGFGPTQLQCSTHVMLCSWVKRTSMLRVQRTVSLQLSTSVRNSDLTVHGMRRALLIRHKCQIMCLKEWTGRSSCRHAEASYATLSADSDCCVSLFGLPAFSNCSGEKGAVKCLISFICVLLFNEFKF